MLVATLSSACPIVHDNHYYCPCHTHTCPTMSLEEFDKIQMAYQVMWNVYWSATILILQQCN